MITRERQRRRPARLEVGLGVAVGVLVLLGVAVVAAFGPLLRLDEAVSRAAYVGDHPSTATRIALETVTAPGLSVFRFVVFLPVLAWLLARRGWRTAAWVLTAIALIGPLTTLLKDLTGRVRPPFENGGARYASLSYPSGHSSGIATLVVVALVLAWPRLSRRARRGWLWAGVVVTLVVGLSRLALGVHYPSDVVGGWALGVAWSIGVAMAFDALPGGRAALPEREGMVQRIVLAPDDGSLGPLLRVADDRLAPGAGYGRHEHRAVDVVAIVLAGSLRHRWDGDVPLAAGDVAVLRAGAGLEHDEVAGPDGARVLQCYLRSAQPDRPATHEVHRGAAGWVDLGRPDARLWLGSAGDGAPSGLRLAVTPEGVTVTDGPPAGTRLLVWELDSGRPAWATD